MMENWLFLLTGGATAWKLPACVLVVMMMVKGSKVHYVCLEKENNYLADLL